ncbi:pectinesterase 3 [Lotus japonicus]|uniref:pectinesterase 3 n=1 Tax=Lotus japonicus TaxID=34305 RepID=UPI0025908BDF|nr:pectinesterase 3 [Lotus japonicus]
MDTVKVLKGYGKVEEEKHNHHHHHHHNLEDQQQRNQHHHRKASTAIISILAILFFTLALAFTLATLLHHTTTTTKPPHKQQQPLNSADSIRTVCNVTRFPDSCIAAVSSSNDHPTDPQSILTLSLRASVDELASVASSLGVKASSSNGQGVADCKDQVDDALSRLNDSLSAMAVVPGGVTLTDAKISDIQTWVSAAVTDQQTCLDGLEEVGSVVVEEVKNMMKKSSEYVSNSLAIVANIRTLSQQFHMPLH